MNRNTDAFLVRLTNTFGSVVNPCCHEQKTSLFRVIGIDGLPTGEEVCLCNGCGRELPPNDLLWPQGLARSSLGQ